MSEDGHVVCLIHSFPNQSIPQINQYLASPSSPYRYRMPPCASTCGNAGYRVPYARDKVRARSVFKIKPYPLDLVQTELMTHGPVATVITVFEDFIHYKSGVYVDNRDDKCN